MSLRIADALKLAEAEPTRIAYKRQLELFDQWLNGREVSYETVLDYRVKLVADDLTPQNINQALAAIRFYARAAVAGNWVTPEVGARLKEVKNLKVKGRALGNWLGIEDAQTLLNAPSTQTVSGFRDRAILALLIGAGLRRSEVVALQVKHFEQRDAGHGKQRWLLVNLKGKHGRARNIPIADWVKAIVDRWLDRALIRSGVVFRSVRDEPLKIGKTGLSPQMVYYVVEEYATKVGRPQIKPHDLRRTFARLAYEGGAPLGEIQQSLGHGSVRVTEDYVNAVQDIQSSPSDVLGIEVEV